MGNQESDPIGALTPTELPRRGEIEPATDKPGRVNAQSVYLGELSEGSRRAAFWRLETAARLLDTPGLVRWSSLTYAQAVEIRGRACERYAPKTAAAIMATVRGACRTAWKLGEMTGEAYQRIQSIPPVKGRSAPTGRHVTRAEVRDLLGACGGNAAGVRDLALLGVLFGAGLRRGEVADLRLEDVGAGHLTVRKGKGGKGRRVPISASLRSLLDAWVACRGNDPGPLFCPVTKGGTIVRSSLSGEAIRKRLHAISLRAGVEPLRPHDARRAYASTLLDAGADLAVVARLMGHASIQVTAGYDRRGEIAEVEAANLIRLPISEKRTTADPEGEKIA